MPSSALRSLLIRAALTVFMAVPLAACDSLGPEVEDFVVVSSDSTVWREGFTHQFHAKRGDEVVTEAAAWASSDTSIATVSNAAGTKGLATARRGGNVHIMALLDSDSATAQLTLPKLDSIAFNPLDSILPIGMTRQYAAVGRYADNSDVTLTTLATWSSSDSLLLRVDNAATKGFAERLGTGAATVSVSFATRTDSLVFHRTCAEVESGLYFDDPSAPIMVTGGSVWAFTYNAGANNRSLVRVPDPGTKSTVLSGMGPLVSAVGQHGNNFGTQIDWSEAQLSNNAGVIYRLAGGEVVRLADTFAQSYLGASGAVRFWVDTVTIDLGNGATAMGRAVYRLDDAGLSRMSPDTSAQVRDLFRVDVPNGLAIGADGAYAIIAFDDQRHLARFAFTPDSLGTHPITILRTIGGATSWLAGMGGEVYVFVCPAGDGACTISTPGGSILASADGLAAHNTFTDFSGNYVYHWAATDPAGTGVYRISVPGGSRTRVVGNCDFGHVQGMAASSSKLYLVRAGAQSGQATILGYQIP